MPGRKDLKMMRMGTLRSFVKFYLMNVTLRVQFITLCFAVWMLLKRGKPLGLGLGLGLVQTLNLHNPFYI